MKKRLYTRFIGILVSEDTYGEIKAITDEKEISITQFIRDLITRHLKFRRAKGGSGK